MKLKAFAVASVLTSPLVSPVLAIAALCVWASCSEIKADSAVDFDCKPVNIVDRVGWQCSNPTAVCFVLDNSISCK